MGPTGAFSSNRLEAVDEGTAVVTKRRPVKSVILPLVSRKLQLCELITSSFWVNYTARIYDDKHTGGEGVS
jgi:hypothetical protein